ncbi:hypothetical protein T459_29509 [Capsicum annuum]|uniref:Uncharacterized protein n=1 Tax=Capsicum annuum TaxID=4072 RepID=A0A2G2Y5S8_CAPAN|nr:hypothetical protein T459_29509 [Capsicum annuum]
MDDDFNPENPDVKKNDSEVEASSDESTIKVWDFTRCQEERSLSGNWILSASKDQIKILYDIKAMKDLESFHGHQNLQMHMKLKKACNSARDKFNLGQQGLGDQNNVLGRMPANFPGLEAIIRRGGIAVFLK